MPFRQPDARTLTTSKPRHARLRVEALEERLALYSTSGNLWPHPELVTLSFVPDGTIVGADVYGPITSNLFATLDAAYGSTAAWQKEILRAAQVWAQQTNINFKLVADDGSDLGSGGNQQGDASFGDIRLGGYNRTDTVLAEAYAPPPVNNQPFAGDLLFNTSQTWNAGGVYDVYTVAVHEIGHALGLYHSGVISAQMYANWQGVKTVLTLDDVAGIRNIYSNNLARANDTWDATTNNLVATADNLTGLLDGWTKTALVENLHLVTGDVDYYKVTAPTGTASTFKVQVQTEGLSLLRAKFDVYASNGTTLLGSATTAYGDYDGTTLSVTLSGVTAGTTYVIKVSGAETGTGPWQSFNTGRYALTLNFGTGEDPVVTLPDTLTPNGAGGSGGGGQAAKVSETVRANTTTSNDQYLHYSGSHPMAMAANGDYVLVWTSAGQDGDEGGIYGQRYNAAGVPQGSEFLVNTHTAGEQFGASVAMADDGDFVVVWSSHGQDGSGTGIYAQRFNAAGEKQGGEFRVNTTTADDQQHPVVAIDGNGSFVVAWSGYTSSGAQDVYFQRFNPGGGDQGSETRANTYLTNDQWHPSIGMDSSGNFVLAWHSNGQDGSSDGVYAQRFDSSGVALGSEFRVNTTTSSYQWLPRVSTNDNGAFVVIWEGNGSGDSYGIFGQRYSSSGAAQGGEFRVNTTTTSTQENSSVNLENSGAFTVTWLSSASGTTGRDVVGQQYGPSGAALGTEFRVTTTSATSSDGTAVVADDSGHLVIAWSGSGSGDSQGVFFQRFNTAGGSGMSYMVPHPFGLTHEHDGECGHQPAGCGCPTCAVAVAEVRPVTSLPGLHVGLPSSLSRPNVRPLLQALLASLVGSGSLPPARLVTPSTAAGGVPLLVGVDLTRFLAWQDTSTVTAFAHRAERDEADPGDPFCTSVPAFGGCFWFSPLS